MTHEQLDAEFDERLAREGLPDDTPSETPAMQLREKILDRLPDLKKDGICPVPNKRFWDYYNAGGKERLHEAGISLKKDPEDGIWKIRLHPETAEDRKQKKIDAFLLTFNETCECGKEIVLQATQAKNGVMQYRLRCEGWFLFHRWVDDSGHPCRRRECYLPGYSNALPHDVVEYLRDFIRVIDTESEYPSKENNDTKMGLFDP